MPYKLLDDETGLEFTCRDKATHFVIIQGYTDTSSDYPSNMQVLKAFELARECINPSVCYISYNGLGFSYGVPLPCNTKN